ncbi:MAG: nicotinate phosphoribosyltransferase, partial [Sphaerochaetaceae bacterium]
TSNTLAAKVFDIPVAGTMAHSWVMSFENELEAFRAFAEIYPDNTILLIDTYDTLGSGIENAIIVGQALKAKGKRLGVRLDSGDLSYLSREIRDKLDKAGLTDARIYASNDLNEEIIETLKHDNVPIDSWGIGTHLVTGGSQSSLNGVYKLAARESEDGSWVETMKITNSFEKATNPGRKQVWRFFDENDSPLADLITLEDEKISLDEDYLFYHPFSEVDFFTMRKERFKSVKPLLQLCMVDGKRVSESPRVKEVQQRALKGLRAFHSTYKRLMNPHIYKVSLSSELKRMKTRLAFEGLQKLNNR